jgi:hypothetical protein
MGPAIRTPSCRALTKDGRRVGTWERRRCGNDSMPSSVAGRATHVPRCRFFGSPVTRWSQPGAHVPRPSLPPPQPYLVLWDTPCSCEAYGSRSASNCVPLLLRARQQRAEEPKKVVWQLGVGGSQRDRGDHRFSLAQDVHRQALRHHAQPFVKDKLAPGKP